MAHHTHGRRDIRHPAAGGLHPRRPPGTPPRTRPVPRAAPARRAAPGALARRRPRLHEPGRRRGRDRHSGATGRQPGRVDRAGRSRPEDRGQPRPLLRAYAHAVDSRALPAHWVSRFLEGAATAEAGFDGFADEAEFQAYLDAYAWPGVLVFTGLQYQGGPDPEQAAAWRRFVDAAQRVDFLADLAGDLADGRLCIPRARLDEHSVTRADLEQARDTPAVRALLAAETGRARAALEATDGILDLADPGLRPVTATMKELMAQQLTAVERAGITALRRDTGYGLVAPLRTLLRARAGVRSRTP
ncbi:squalene/phytoene synthase family protein [Streptomyces sp. NBC_00162]|uniref:squalene/phytoene synthase family protein n=1 Tax=Streptomyces sp. NBC_00162 TaxID=2903629 RepID=UPI002B003223|nr:squalene/phytoene synthase family protein [Streptomyces sp. NBC_00162]